MSLQQLKKKTEGFTIIEVLIVLAIAGLILLIVFLAVPALQRNSRNTQRTDDVARVLGAAQEVLNNNNGSLAALDDAHLQAAVGDSLAYYEIANVTVAGSGANGAIDNVDAIQIRTGASCATNGDAADGTTRQLVAQFTVEGGNGTVGRCQSS